MPEPTRRKSKYSKEEIEAIKRKRTKRAENAKSKRGKWHWFMTLMIIGFLCGIASVAFLIPQIIIPWWHVLLIILAAALIGAIVQFSYFKKKQIITDNQKITEPLYLGYNIVGVGLISLFLVLLLNQLFSSSEIIQETHRIVGVDPEYKIYRWGAVVFLLESDEFAGDAEMRALPYKVYYKYEEHPYIEYDFYQGLFGYRIIGEHRLAKKIEDE